MHPYSYFNLLTITTGCQQEMNLQVLTEPQTHIIKYRSLILLHVSTGWNPVTLLREGAKNGNTMAL